MSIGCSYSQISLAYIDELLADIQQSQHKSVQFVFQRLLVVCGRGGRAVWEHAANHLLSAVAFHPLAPNPAAHGTKTLDEFAAAQIFALLIRFAVEEQPATRGAVQIRGASRLFECVADRISYLLQGIPESTVVAKVELIFNKILPLVDQIHQTAFLASITPIEVTYVFQSLLEQLFPAFFSKLLDKNPGGALRSEFLVRVLHCFVQINPKDPDPIVVLAILKKVITDKNRHLLQPYIFLLLGLKSIEVDPSVSLTLSTRNLINQCEHLLNSGQFPGQYEKLESVMSSTNSSLLAAVIAEGGELCMHSDDELKALLTRAGLCDPQSLDAQSVANAIVRMIKTAGGIAVSFKDSRRIEGDDIRVTDCKWNGQMFARVIREMAPWLDWTEVACLLDQSGFVVHPHSLHLLTDVLREGMGGADFPVKALYREWKERVGQLSWLSCLVSYPEVLCLGELPHKEANLSLLKVQPEDKKDVQQWRSLDLIETMLRLFESVPADAQPVIVRAFQQAMTACPDLLLLAFFTIPMPMTTLRQNLLAPLISMVCSTPNAVPVLNAGWNSETLPKKTINALILSALVNMYRAKDDAAKLTKILEIAHELKPDGLSSLFAAGPHPFCIDLACLASKRDFLKLDKWLEDRHSEYGEPFALAVLQQMKRKLPLGAVAGGGGATLPQETYAILLAFCSKVANGSETFRPEYVALLTQLRQLQMKNESSRSGSFSGRPASSSSGPYFGAPGGAQQSPVGGFGSGPSGFGAPPGGFSQQQPQQQPSPMFGGFGPKPAQTPPLPQPNFGGQPHSMSPSNAMMRSAMPPGGRAPGAAASSGWPPQPTPRTPGATTPSGHDSAGAANNEDLSQCTFTDDVQDEANNYFEQIYSPGPPNGPTRMTVNDLVARLKQFRHSSNTKDQKILACVVKNLFEEYKFFNEYPERELTTTAEVYGGIIREEIIVNLQFATAVRKVIESLQSQVGSMLWKFGIVALNACRTKLCLYPKVCQMISQNPNFGQFPPNLAEYVKSGCNMQLPAIHGRDTPPSWTQQPQRTNSGDGSKIAVPLPNSRTGNSVLSYTNTDTLVAATEKEGDVVVQPGETVVEKIAFLFNNLSQSNLTQKTDEIRGLLKSEGDSFCRWLAQYIVMNRVSVEQNFQPLYFSFIVAIDNKDLDRHIKTETFRNIRILLRADKRQAASNYSDRQLLKNLGLWLGQITIARGKPIVVSDLDLKSLLLEAYYKGSQELLFVVPFIAKILIACAKTPIFTATCAWVRSILKVLAELHNESDLKINLKFEIEVLCKELSVDLHSLPIEGVLKDTERLVRLKQQLSDLKDLKQPDGLGSSPVPSSMRFDSGLMPGSDTKRSTPAPDADPNAPEQQLQQMPAHFSYHDINVVSLDGLLPHLKILPTLPLFQMHPQLKTIVKQVINMTIRELIEPVTQRSLKVAMTVTEQVVKKDFQLEADEQKMRRASHQMMRAMTAGMAAITCRDPFTSSMQNYLVQGFTNSLRGAMTVETQKMIEQAAHVITADNVELATNFIVKTACEKATPKLDEKLSSEFAAREAARTAGREWTNEAAAAEQASLPEKLRRAGATTTTTAQQMAVYEEFAARICGFKPSSADEHLSDFSGSKANATTLSDKELEVFVAQIGIVVREVTTMLSARDPQPTNKGYQAVVAMRDSLSQLAAAPRDPVQLYNAVLRAVEQLLFAYQVDPATRQSSDWVLRAGELFVGFCRILQALMPLHELQRKVTAIILSNRMDSRYNVDAMEFLYKHQLLLCAEYDAFLAQLMDGGGNLQASIFAQRLIKAMSTSDHPLASHEVLRRNFPRVIEELRKIQQMQMGARPTPTTDTPVGFPQQAGSKDAQNGWPEAARPEGVPDDQPELQGKVEMILREWISLCYTPMAQREPQQALATMIHMMHEQGVLSNDEMITRFFRLCTEMCVDVSYRLLKVQNEQGQNSTVTRQRCYYTLDAFVKLTCLMVKHSDGSQHQTKINLLKKVLNIVTSVLHNDHQLRRNEFQAMPYHRILIIMFNELTAPDPALEPIAWNILEAFGQALFILQPRRVPGFTYAWLDIVGHRNVIARLLGENCDGLRTGAMYTQLIICHLKFLAPFLRNIQLPKTVAVLYKGTLRVLLVILHDFPELLCEYHYVICDAIPPNCVQLRNLVLSAYPRNMRLPDPFALNFKQIDAIAEMGEEPKNHISMTTIIPPELRAQLDVYLTSRSPVEFLSTLPSLLQVSQTPGSKYNTTVMNAVVLYVGIRAIGNLHERGQRISMTTIAHNAYMDIFQNLAVQLCTEGRYLLFNAIANQLRYPNAHTHYFSCTFLFLFLHADSPAIQEQITRILFERLVALRPHPWGLLITFIELIKNPTYNFWRHEFTRCAPEIERLFQNVANTCVSNTTATQRAGAALAAAAGGSEAK